MPETLTIETPAAGVALITLRRPEKLNALNWTMVDELLEALAVIGRDRQVRVVVMTGEGRGFCSGMDLGLDDAVGTADGVVEVLERQERLASLALSLKGLRQPVIAAVNGPAAGGGAALAFGADVRLGSTAARFNVAFVRIGLSGCDVGVSYLLPRIVGAGIASEMMLTGRQVEADEALRIGLLNRVVEPGELLDAALELAGAIMANSPFAVEMTKQVLHRNIDAPSLETALELENRTQVLATRTEDMGEALAAFLAKRPPRFTGR
jgi:enoyl-CoA hydratase